MELKKPPIGGALRIMINFIKYYTIRNSSTFVFFFLMHGFNFIFVPILKNVFFQGTPGLPGPIGDKGIRGDKGDRGLTTTLKGDQFPTGIIEGPPGPPGPPGNDTVIDNSLLFKFVDFTARQYIIDISTYTTAQ